MKNKKIIFIALLCLIFCYATPSYASLFINFGETDISPVPPDSDPGDYDHEYSTSFGDITFNGRIWKKLDHIKIGDHTPDMTP